MNARPSRKPDAPSAIAPIPDGRAAASGPSAAVGRVSLRLDEVAATLGISRRALERERSAGRFPRADLTIGRMPSWRPETIRAWVEGGGR